MVTNGNVQYGKVQRVYINTTNEIWDMAFGMDEGFNVLFQTKTLEAGYEICSHSIVSIVHVKIELPEQYYIR